MIVRPADRGEGGGIFARPRIVRALPAEWGYPKRRRPVPPVGTSRSDGAGSQTKTLASSWIGRRSLAFDAAGEPVDVDDPAAMDATGDRLDAVVGFDLKG